MENVLLKQAFGLDNANWYQLGIIVGNITVWKRSPCFYRTHGSWKSKGWLAMLLNIRDMNKSLRSNMCHGLHTLFPFLQSLRHPGHTPSRYSLFYLLWVSFGSNKHICVSFVTPPTFLHKRQHAVDRYLVRLFWFVGLLLFVYCPTCEWDHRLLSFPDWLDPLSILPLHLEHSFWGILNIVWRWEIRKSRTTTGLFVFHSSAASCSHSVPRQHQHPQPDLFTASARRPSAKQVLRFLITIHCHSQFRSW